MYPAPLWIITCLRRHFSLVGQLRLLQKRPARAQKEKSLPWLKSFLQLTISTSAPSPPPLVENWNSRVTQSLDSFAGKKDGSSSCCMLSNVHTMVTWDGSSSRRQAGGQFDRHMSRGMRRTALSALRVPVTEQRRLDRFALRPPSLTIAAWLSWIATLKSTANALTSSNRTDVFNNRYIA